jgi:hypothetical protein
VISATDLTIAIVPEDWPVIVLFTKLLILTVVPEYVEPNLIERRLLSNNRAPPVTIDPLVNTCLPNLLIWSWICVWSWVIPLLEQHIQDGIEFDDSF